MHTVQRGDMIIRERATGSIVSLQPPKAAVTLLDRAASCKVGQAASAQIKPPQVISGKVASVDGNGCQIEFSDAIPSTVEIGDKLGALIETGVMRDVIFFERPASSSENSDSFAFVIEPGGGYARRVAVHYGKLSGSMIQVISGLSPGDHVIVTDTAKWNQSPRVHLQ